jgi:hypothetical protein
MAKRNVLLPRVRSRNHVWWWRLAAFGGAVVGTGLAAGAILAAVHEKPESAVWKIAAVVVVLLVALGIVLLALGGVAAFLTRPVSDEHAAALKASAVVVARSLTRSDACDYGDDLAKQAFCVHFPKLEKRLVAWDSVAVVAPSQAKGALEWHLDAAMVEHEVTDAEADVGYNVPEITKYARELAMARARGLIREVPHIEWAGFTNAPPTAGDCIVGTREGKLRPNGGPDWISLAPLDGETVPQWNERADVYTRRVDDLMAAVYDTALPYAQAVVAAEQQLEAFKQDELPTILAALDFIQVREPPCVRHECESC